MRKTVQIQKELKKEFPQFPFSDTQLTQIEDYLSLFHQWNQKMNLSSIRDWNEQFSKHVIDSCALLLLPNFKPQGQSMDLGSGGGLPGVILAILFPELEIRSIDKVFKKITFQKTVKGRLGLKNFFPEHVRLEDWEESQEHKNTYQFIFSRAMDQITGILNWADLFLHPDGQMILWKGQQWETEWKQCSNEQKERYSLENFLYHFPDYNLGGHLIKLTRL